MLLNDVIVGVSYTSNLWESVMMSPLLA